LEQHTASGMFEFGSRYGLFVGPILQNAFHKHYAIQMSVSTQSEITLILAGDIQHKGHAFFIPSNRPHQLFCTSSHLTLLIHPLSVLGHYFHLQMASGTLFPKDRVLLEDLKNHLQSLEQGKWSFPMFCQHIDVLLSSWEQQFKPDEAQIDARISKALSYMEHHPDVLFSLEQMAELCHLSPSRFLHLFKEKTGIQFRRYQLWNRLIASLPQLQTHAITEVAHAFSFSDAAHYNRTFKETFGVTPKFLR
jgi:AraC-like DNA-binding protein